MPCARRASKRPSAPASSSICATPDVARLELLNDALDPLFDEVPDDVDLFDRGVSKGDMPRLWIDVVAHVEMGRDKRQYRFVQDTRYGRAVLAESYEVPAMADAITRYVARRLVERERAFADDAGRGVAQAVLYHGRRQRRWRAVGMFILGLVAGIAALIALAMLHAALADQTDLVLLHDRARGAEAARNHRRSARRRARRRFCRGCSRPRPCRVRARWMPTARRLRARACHSVRAAN